MDHKSSGHNNPPTNLQGEIVNKFAVIHAAHPWHMPKRDVFFFPWCLHSPHSFPTPDLKYNLPMNSNPLYVTCKWCANRIAEWRAYQGTEPPMTGYNFNTPGFTDAARLQQDNKKPPIMKTEGHVSFAGNFRAEELDESIVLVRVASKRR